MQRRKEIKMQLWILVTISLRTPRLCVKIPSEVCTQRPAFAKASADKAQRNKDAIMDSRNYFFAYPASLREISR